MGFRAGRGIADITGEAAECGLLGYGRADQQSAGIHTRQRARAFAFEEHGVRLLLVVCELPLMSDAVVREVLRRLPEGYGASNVMLTATHTHCGPGGYFHHRLYNSNTGGFRERTFDAITDGITEAARAAVADLAPGHLRLAHGELTGASVNRSRRAFERNPADERAHFPDGVDPQTTLLAIERDGRLVGAVNWFATHNTSMTNRNRLISADNKGYAALHWERAVGGVDHLSGAAPELVTAFAQTNAGDMSPNLRLAPGRGPTDDQFANTRIIGTRQYEAAAALTGGRVISGGLDFRATRVHLSAVEVRPEFTGDGRVHRTSPPMAGAAAFAGARVDGPGFRGFRPGANPLWDAVSRRLVYPLAPALRDAQYPKALALPAGPLNRIVPMVQEYAALQLLRIGPLFLIGIPGEVTVVAGLRLRRTVAAIVGADPRDVLVAGYSNGYVHYVTTPEEYDAQEYEGGSTLFGRWELPALCQSVAGLATALRDGTPVDPGTPEPARPARPARRRSGPDAPHPGRRFGDLLDFSLIGRRATASFVAAHPSNDLRRGGSYLSVERRGPDGSWTRVADDGDWSTVFRWTRAGAATSIATVTWNIPADTPPGAYRVGYHGDSAKGPFTGVSGPFEVG
ncbi:alkaline ceramidase [Streptomyces sp. SDr-06]|uniref:neutral/alkaline non-lysosomal ceramidase N-terminal domain-containing protein n=1 Tax=Streptomyces sp. SDr-06 TaxID=2267702 RepID=UPI000DE97559|nr:neutral/alkaline non-lysosomal ceramidase N-terminal domain-containing protein [Streptomyces sp. SDr-06]RCH70575.1 alkaline ceramidase [Streptomyces sp. SDr-06]